MHCPCLMYFIKHLTWLSGGHVAPMGELGTVERAGGKVERLGRGRRDREKR